MFILLIGEQCQIAMKLISEVEGDLKKHIVYTEYILIMFV